MPKYTYSISDHTDWVEQSLWEVTLEADSLEEADKKAAAYIVNSFGFTLSIKVYDKIHN